jgi:hypothetical protein
MLRVWRVGRAQDIVELGGGLGLVIFFLFAMVLSSSDLLQHEGFVCIV